MPNIDLPLITFTRSKFGKYKEYHTSNDDMNFISTKGFEGSFKFLKKIIDYCEKNEVYLNNIYVEPFMTKLKLGNTLSSLKNTNASNINYKRSKNIRDILILLDGTNDINDIMKKLKLDKSELMKYLFYLLDNKLIR